MIAVGTLCAFLGAWIGARYLQKATITAIRWIVAIMMITIGIGLVLGLLGS